MAIEHGIPNPNSDITDSYETGLHNPVSSMSFRGRGLGGAARKLLFVHGVRFAALLGIGGGSEVRLLQPESVHPSERQRRSATT